MKRHITRDYYILQVICFLLLILQMIHLKFLLPLAWWKPFEENSLSSESSWPNSKECNFCKWTVLLNKKCIFLWLIWLTKKSNSKVLDNGCVSENQVAQRRVWHKRNLCRKRTGGEYDTLCTLGRLKYLICSEQLNKIKQKVPVLANCVESKNPIPVYHYTVYRT